MSGRNLSTFAEANLAAGRRRVNWTERRPMIVDTFPDVDEPDWAQIFDDDTALERALTDVLKFAQAEPGRDGPRPNLDWDKGMASWRQITGQDYTGLPFAQAFRAIARNGDGTPHALSLIARKTSISRSRVHRLITGAEEPDLDVMRAVANAYGKQPQFFREYRAQVIAEHFVGVLVDNPEFSVTVFRRVARRLA